MVYVDTYYFSGMFFKKYLTKEIWRSIHNMW